MRVQLRDVKVDIGKQHLLSTLSFRAKSGQMSCLTGPSGSGKTTALNVASLLITPSQGDVLLDGQRASHWNDRQRRAFWREHASFVFQDLSIVLDESVSSNVQLGIPGSWLSRAERRLKCREALTRVGLYDRVDEVTSHLSGGERQRVAIARAIAKGSDVLFVEEPTASLDVDNCNIVYDLLRELADGGALVLIATHDVALVSRCDEEVPVSAHRS